MAVGHQPGHRRVDLRQRVPARRMAQRDRPDVAFPEHRGALRQVLHRAPDDLPDAEPRRLWTQRRLRTQIGPARGPDGLSRRAFAAPRPRDARVARDPEPLGPRPPIRPQRVDIPVGLAPAGDQRRLLRQRRAPRKTVLVQPGEDLAAPRGERVQQRPRVARDLEARHPADHRPLDPEALLDQPPGQLLAVIGADHLHVAPDLRRLDAPPRPRPVPRHVGEDAVRVELRVLVPARQVPEAGRHQTVRRHPRAPPRRRVVGPGLQQLLLNPVERRPDRRIVRGDDPPVALEQRFQRHRLGRRQREVEPRTMLVLPVTRPPEADLRPRHVACQDALEALRRDMLRQAQRRRRLAVPEARPALPRVVLRVIPLARKIRDRRRRRAEIAQARDHRSPSASGGGSRAARRRAAHG